MVVVVVVVVSMDMIELFDVVLLLMVPRELNEPNLTGRGGVTERTINTK